MSTYERFGSHVNTANNNASWTEVPGFLVYCGILVVISGLFLWKLQEYCEYYSNTEWTEQRLWVDGPFELIPTPSKAFDASTRTHPHASVICASEMAHMHNIIVRGLNAIYRQGPFVTASPDISDISDFLFFCTAWVKVVEYHHHTEETLLFPELEKFTNDKKILKEILGQHEVFHTGLMEFNYYAHKTTPEEYNWKDVKAKLDAFAPSLITHLHDEIDILLNLKDEESIGLLKAWEKTKDAVKGDIRLPNVLDTMLPMTLGCADRTYEGGIHDFPPLPFFVPYVMDYWFAWTHRGAWRFCPCDMYGQPRPLAFSAIIVGQRG